MNSEQYQKLLFYAPPEAPRPNAKGEVPPAAATTLVKNPEEPSTPQTVPNTGDGTHTILGSL